MSEQKSYPRPRQVTTAGILGAVGGTLLVLSLFDSVSRLRTVETRDAVEEFLAEPPGDGLGVSVAWVLDALHVVMLVNGALAAVATVLAVYLFWGHRGARIGFTVVSGILLFTSPFSGGVLAVLLAVAAVMLWSRPAREWFAGRDPAEPVADEVFAARRREQPDPSWAPPSARSDRPDAAGWQPERERASGRPADRPAEPAGDRAGDRSEPASSERSADQPPPAAHRFGEPVRQQWSPPAPQPAPTPTGYAPTERPGAVAVASLVTWGLTSMVLFVFVVVVAMLMGGQQALLDQIAQDPVAATLDMGTGDLLALLWVVSALIIFWCLCAAALAVLVLKRQNWARVLLTISCVMTIVVSAAVGVTGMNLPAALVCMVYVVGSGLTIVLLYTRRSSAWFSGAGWSGPQPPYDGPGAPERHGSGHAPGWAPPSSSQAPPSSSQGPPQRPSGKPPVW